MRIAVMDIGTQTFRAAAVRIDGGRVERLFSCRYNVRLGEELHRSGTIGAEALERAALALEQIAGMCAEAGVERFRAVGTAVLRASSNADEFLALAAERLPGEVEVIGPEEEAELAVAGAVATLPELKDEPFLLVDAGGGSTELLYSRPGLRPRLIDSMPVGAVTLYKRHVHSDPPAQDEWRAMQQEVTSCLATASMVQTIRTWVAVGGTACLLASLRQGLLSYDPRRIRGFRLTGEDLALTAELLLSHNLEQRRRLPGMESERADIAVAGLAIYVTLRRYFGSRDFLVSDGGLLMGLVATQLEKELHGYAEPPNTAGLYL